MKKDWTIELKIHQSSNAFRVTKIVDWSLRMMKCFKAYFEGLRVEPDWCKSIRDSKYTGY